jgi:hypothetical protein
VGVTHPNLGQAQELAPTNSETGKIRPKRRVLSMSIFGRIIGAIKMPGVLNYEEEMF